VDAVDQIEVGLKNQQKQQQQHALSAKKQNKDKKKFDLNLGQLNEKASYQYKHPNNMQNQ
jgi:hypothetical protein